MRKAVEFSEENFHHCRCGICPVQYGNECVRKVLEENHDFEEAVKTPKNNAKLYCSIGRSSCEGLKKKRPCLCPTCAVWYKNNLGKTHFCTEGSATEREEKA
jgi:hypothetical protein